MRSFWAALGGSKMKLLVEAVIIVIVLYIAVRFLGKGGNNPSAV